MARPAYSKQFVAAAGLTTAINLPVPEGKVWVIRDIDVFWVSGLSAANIQVGEVNSRATFYYARLGDSTLPTVNEHQQWRGRVVLPFGQRLGVLTDGALDVFVCGYELDA